MSTIEEHPLGCQVNQPLAEREDLTIVSIVGDELCVDEVLPSGTFRSIWKEVKGLPSEYTLIVRDKWYQFDRAI